MKQKEPVLTECLVSSASGTEGKEMRLADLKERGAGEGREGRAEPEGGEGAGFVHPRILVTSSC